MWSDQDFVGAKKRTRSGEIPRFSIKSLIARALSLSDCLDRAAESLRVRVEDGKALSTRDQIWRVELVIFWKLLKHPKEIDLVEKDLDSGKGGRSSGGVKQTQVRGRFSIVSEKEEANSGGVTMESPMKKSILLVPVVPCMPI